MPELAQALAHVKKAAAGANMQLGVLSQPKAAAIIGACDDILAGQLLDQSVVDVIQGGAGTSTNTIARPARRSPPTAYRVSSLTVLFWRNASLSQ